MKKLIILIVAVLSLALQPLSAQNNQGSEDYKYFKAREILNDRGDEKEARKLIEENIDEHPKHIPSYLLLAGMQRNHEEYSAAMATINAALKNNHKGSGISDAKLQWWKASIYVDLEEYDTALKMMQQVVKAGRQTDKEDLDEMLQSLGQIQYDLKMYDEADQTYKEMLRIDETDQMPMVGLARNMIARERYDEALEILEKCKKYDSGYSEIYRFEVQAYEGKKDYKKMIDAMVMHYEKTNDADNLNISRFMKDRRYGVAVIKQKIKTSKENVLWKIILTMVYRKSHAYVDAIALLDEIMNEYGKDEDLLAERAECYDDLGMVERAAADYAKVIEMTEGSEAAYNHGLRSQVYLYAGLYEEAIKDINVYIEYNPTEAYGYYARGWCKELSGDDKGALEDYENGIAVDESYPYLYLMRGEQYLKYGQREKAMADFETVVQKDTVVDGGSCRHYALYFLGKEAEAIEWADKIIEKDPEDPGNWYDKTCLLCRMGRLDEAMTCLTTAFEKGFRKFGHLEHDDDVDPLRDREDYKALIAKYEEMLKGEIADFKVESAQQTEPVLAEVEMRKMYGGTYEVPCSVNGLPLKMIFDTGASDVTISSVEANFMFKNGYLTDNDVKGKKHYRTASGDIHEGTVLKLKEVKLGDAVLKNIEASVVHSQRAPLLLGQSVLEKFGTITIDNVNSKLLIKQ